MTSLLWFRKGLRLHDNPALLSALQDATNFIPVFVLDPRFLDPSRVGANRMRFLLEALKDLDDSLTRLGSRLVVERGDPTKVLPELFVKHRITKLCFEKDTEPYAKIRDKNIKQKASELGIQVSDHVSHTLYDMEELSSLNGGKYCTVYRSFLTLCNKKGSPAKPVSTPPFSTKLPPLPLEYQDRLKYCVPSLEEINYPVFETASRFPGGETQAIIRLEAFIQDKARVCGFSKPHTSPAAFDPPSTTVLSPYLKFGCLSPRLFYHKLIQIHSEYRGKKTEPPVSLVGQLMWREFFYYSGNNVPNFAQMKENPICIQIGWDSDPDSEKHFEAWKNGKTGYPWIDAIMRQLHREGWMHHLARHSVACFLTRGDLWVSWEKGAQVFDWLLLDSDWSLNNGNWMWLSASSFFYQYFRVYSPVTFGKKWDPEGLLIKKYIPELSKYPSKYIYEPWKAPPEVQKQSGCIIGKDYPSPIVDHDVVRVRNIARMKAAYETHRKLNGSLGGDNEEEDGAGDASDDEAAPQTKSRAKRPAPSTASSPSPATSTRSEAEGTTAAKKPSLPSTKTGAQTRRQTRLADFFSPQTANKHDNK